MSDVRRLSTTQLAKLGVSQIAYIKPVRLKSGEKGFAIFAADGTPMAVAAERDLAYEAILQHELVPVALH